MSHVLQVWHATEGKIGLDGMDRFTGHVVDALSEIDRGRSACMEAEAKK